MSNMTYKLYEIPTIKLNEKYFAQILNGNKTTTIRLGEREYPTGDAIFYCTKARKVLMVHLNGFATKQAEQLSDIDAINGGYSSLSEMMTDLVAIYPNMSPQDTVTILRFYL